MTASITSERRESVRLKGRKEAIIITPNGMHNILDISKNGLSFECSGEEYFSTRWPVGIVYAGTDLYMKEITVQMVREKFIVPETLIAQSSKEIGVKFVDMDDSCKLILNKLLAYHSV